MYVHLELVLHHLKLGYDETLSSNEAAFETLRELFHQLVYAKSKELKSRFKRVSLDLFLMLLSFCNAPSLMQASRVCKAWKD